MTVRNYDEMAKFLTERAKELLSPDVSEAVVLVLVTYYSDGRRKAKIHVQGIYSETRTDEDVLLMVNSDLTPGMRRAIFDMCDPFHPIGHDNHIEENAHSTKYDIAVKVGQIGRDTSVVAVLNDPDCSFIERWARADFGDWNAMFVKPLDNLAKEVSELELSAAGE